MKRNKKSSRLNSTMNYNSAVQQVCKQRQHRSCRHFIMLGNLLHPTLKRLAKETHRLYMHTKHNHTIPCLTRCHSWFMVPVSVLCSTNCILFNGHGEQPQHSKIDSIRITAIIFFYCVLVPFFMPMQKPHESNTANNGITRTMRIYESSSSSSSPSSVLLYFTSALFKGRQKIPIF